ncbi:putative rna binding [Phaeomoniella chlamydospora]|uniref:Putative rna binding n=1 Tax=Phaeomoniella chlamydospora TaxID=158046 RepID=A0A0G2EZI5_PHACM|nr:putative rna binding [Phaeomoniella chlamydospora]
MRGNAGQTKVHYVGKDEDFIVFVDDPQAVKDWKNDKSTPLAQVVSGWKVFVTHKHGAQGVLDTASKATLENEFGTSVDDEVVAKILEGGSVQTTENAERQGPKNDSMGGFPAGRS